MYKVQIVDDEPIMRMAMQKMFDWNKMGFEIVYTAQNGAQALEQFGQQDIDLVITDIEMPIMNGIEYIRRIREIKPNQLIVVLTAYEDVEYAKEVFEYGAFEYLLKPVSVEDIGNLLNRVKEKLLEKDIL